MAGEDRFPPHLSPFAKVITEVGSEASSPIRRFVGHRLQSADSGRSGARGLPSQIDP
jgi:hypothetical protein